MRRRFLSLPVWAWLAAASAAGLAACAGAAGVAAVLHRRPGAGLLAPADPYPECPAIRAHIEKNLDDRAAGWELVAWGRRVERGGTVYVGVSYRARNKLGAWQVFGTTFILQGDKVVGNG